MTPRATTLIAAARYSAHRSLRPHEDVIQVWREDYPGLDRHDRAVLIDILETQIVPELARAAESWPEATCIPITKREAQEEADAWLRLMVELRGMP